MTRKSLDAEAARPLCFVAMPILKAGTPENKHFSAIYDSISDVATAMGFEVLRADKVSAPGNIGKDIVTKLAEAAVVIADLTDMNPNVFYEVGIRHALRRNGTVLVIDKARTATIPFDLSQYRVIQFEGDLAGVRKMGEELRITLAEMAPGGDDEALRSTDSPIHDWYPELPSDLIQDSRSKRDPETAAELAELRRQVERYREITAAGARGGTSQNSHAVLNALRQADSAGELAQHYIVAAASAVQAVDVSAFLDATEKLFNAKSTPDERTYLRFSNWAIMLGLGGLSIAILGEAVARNAGREIGDAYIRALARSDSADDRDRARREMAASIGLNLESGILTPPSGLESVSANIGHFMQILHNEGDDLRGLAIMEAAMELEGSEILQNDWARQIDWVGDRVRALKEYSRGIRLSTANQESFRWFANFLHNNGMHVEAAELFLLEAFFDLDDPNGSLHIANEFAFHIFEFFGLKTSPDLVDAMGGRRELPDGYGRSNIIEATRVALSSGSMDAGQRDTLENLARRADLSDADLRGDPLPKSERVAWIRETYLTLRSDLTRECPVGLRLASSAALSN